MRMDKTPRMDYADLRHMPYEQPGGHRRGRRSSVSSPLQPVLAANTEGSHTDADSEATPSQPPRTEEIWTRGSSVSLFN